MEESEEFKWAVKVVIKRQMRSLIDQLRESGEEIAIIAANVKDGSCSHFGSPKGDWFISEQRNLSSTFLSFCKNQDIKPEKSLFNAGSPTTSFLNERNIVESPNKICRVESDDDDDIETPEFDDIATPEYKQEREPGEGLKTKGSLMRPFSYSRKIAESAELNLEDMEKHGWKKKRDPSKTVVRIVVPAYLTYGIQDEEMAAVVGQLVIAKLTSSPIDNLFSKKTGTAASEKTEPVEMKSDTEEEKTDTEEKKTDTEEKKTNTVGSNSTVKRTRSGRVVTSYLQRVQQVKKKTAGRKARDLKKEAVRNNRGGLNRFEVCTVSGSTVDLQSVDIDGRQIDMLAGPVVEALEKCSCLKHLRNINKQVMIVVLRDHKRQSIKVQIDVEDPLTENADLIMTVSDIDDSMDNKADVKVEKTMAAIVKKSITTKLKRRSEITGTGIRIKCPHCKTKVATNKSLKNHIERVHLKIRNHTCEICHGGFWSPSDLRDHIITNHTRQCKSCYEYVVESEPWQEGMTADVPREVTCVCGRKVIIIAKRAMKGHQYENAGKRDKDMDDEIEVKESKTKGAIKVIKRQKLITKLKSKKAYVDQTALCPHCGISMASRKSLKNHIERVHLKIRKHKCEICSRAFWSPSDLETHMISIHTRQCESCKDYVVESEPWEEGMAPNKPREVTCVCGGTVSMFSKRGKKSQKYACGVCGRLFAKKNQCERHGQSHSTITECTCDVCGIGMKNMTALDYHMFRMHGKYVLKCKECKKNFRSEHAMKVHMSKQHPIVTETPVVVQTDMEPQIEESPNENMVEKLLAVAQVVESMGEGHTEDSPAECQVDETMVELQVYKDESQIEES